MEPIPSQPHASRRLFISLIALIVVVLIGLYLHREHVVDVPSFLDRYTTLSEEEQKGIVNMNASGQASEAQLSAQQKAITSTQKSSGKQGISLEEQQNIFK